MHKIASLWSFSYMGRKAKMHEANLDCSLWSENSSLTHIPGSVDTVPFQYGSKCHGLSRTGLTGLKPRETTSQ